MRCATRFFALAACLVLNAGAAINLVTHKVAKDITGAEVTALSTNGYNSTAGNLIVVWVVSYSGSQPIGQITDSAGDTFTPAALQRGTWFGQWFYARNVKGDSFNVVTIHSAIAGRATLIYPAMSVMEFSGADKAAPLAAEITGPQGSLDGAWASKSFDVAAGQLALLGIVTANGGAFTPGPGFKIEDSYLTPNSSKFSFATMDQVFASAQTGVTATVTWTGTLQATGAVIVLK